MGNRLVLAVAVLSIFFATGCAKKADDAAIISNIQSQMFSDPQLKNSDLKVTSAKGEVTLSGTVPSAAARLDAYQLASQTAGVTKVNDQMSVGPAQAPSIASDSAPAAKLTEHDHAPAAAPARKAKAASLSRTAPTVPADVPPQEPTRTAESVPPPPTAIEANSAQPASPSSVVPVAPPAPAPPAPQPKNVVIA
ncbi:MAG: BON domain-containing protein, partial [Candidatus Acidiferrales bacterium]